MSRLDAIIDISHHQKQDIDFKALKAAGIVAVIHKATEGNDLKDKQYEKRRVAAEQAGLRWGAYHFSKNTNDGGSGVEQAKYFLDAVGKPEDVFLSLDFESYKHKDKPKTKLNMSITEAQAFIDEVHKQLGRFPFFYSGSTVREVLGTNTNATFGKCRLWATGYVDEPKLRIHKTWNDWTLWQYTDGKKNHHPKPIDGFGSCDRSVFVGSEDELHAVWAN